MKGKNNFLYLIILIIVIDLIAIGLCLFRMPKSDKTAKAHLQIQKVYTFEDGFSIVDEFDVTEGQILELSKNDVFWNANDIEIVKINNENVEILRYIVKEEKIEKIPETIEYNIIIPVYVRQDNNSDILPELVAPKYDFYLKFSKQ